MDEKRSRARMPSLQGKVALITGANSGLGFETALALAGKNMRVVLASRDEKKAQQAAANICRRYPGAEVSSIRLDLSSLLSVNEFACEFQKNHPSLHLLVNNAGIMLAPLQRTRDGFENHFATNYLGHFALTGLLLPTLTVTIGSRVVTLSSLSYKWAKINFDNLNAEKSYNRFQAYAQSKRACLMFAIELQRRLASAGHPTLSVAAHPGLSKTNLDRYFPVLLRPLGNLFLQPASQGALSVLCASLKQSLKGGEFVGPGGLWQIRGYPTVVETDNDSKDKEIAARLWKISEELTGVRYLPNKVLET